MRSLQELRLLHPTWRELVQILLVAYAIYRVVVFFRGTRSSKIVHGLGILFAAYAAAWYLEFDMIIYLLGFAFQVGVIAMLVIFAPELRAALAHRGQARFPSMVREMEQRVVAEEICEAVERLSRSGIGAIVVIEHQVAMDGYAESGSQMEAKVSADLLTTIFTPYSPLHDGAVIIRGDTIIAAGCILPLSQKVLTDRALGTRHRAALGLTDESDAVVLVVSEERSTVSIAERGRLWRDLAPLELRDVLAGRVPARMAIESA